MFLKLNFTSKCIWGKIPGAKFHFHKNLTLQCPTVYACLFCCDLHICLLKTVQTEIVATKKNYIMKLLIQGYIKFEDTSPYGVL